MNFLKKLIKNASRTRTLNGAVAYETTSDACLDLFAVAGGMRYQKPQRAIELFHRAYIENPELAMKLLFHIRDIREGIGERDVFRNLLRFAAKKWPESVRKNVGLIAEYGRFDDLLCLTHTPVWNTAVEVIRTQLQADLAAVERRNQGELDAPISLLAKWMPSINTSSYKTREKAKILARSLGMDEKTYRKTLALLRANSCITERYLSRKEIKKIQYEAVPAGAMLKHSRQFLQKDTNRFHQYLEDVENGSKTIHASNLFPYQLVNPYLSRSYSWWYDWFSEDIPQDKVLEALWNHLPQIEDNENAISIIDTSGSMYDGIDENRIPPIVKAISLGIYHAERCKGAFHNHFITFESEPHLVQIRGNSLQDKIRYVARANWGGSTNLEAVFDLLLDTAVEVNASREEMPSTLYIISDMEFNIAIRDGNKTIYENAKERFEEHGYRLPAVVFINVNSFQMQTPVRARTRGTAMVSGAGTNNFKHKFDGNITPLDHMLRVLLSSRYEAIHA